MRQTSTSAMAIAAAGFFVGATPQFAMAQSAGAEAQPVVDGANDSVANSDIVVTAERRESTAAKTPIAIVAFSGETLQALQLNNVSKLSTYVPGLNVSSHGVTSGISVVSLRGIGSTSIIGDPTVAFHVDGQYFRLGRSLNSTFYDLARVEILKGPQGTLYGRNSTAGVINVITAAPEYATSGALSGLYGNYDAVQLQGMLNVPLVDDKVAARVAFNVNKHNGYQKGVVQDLDDQNDFSVRGSLLIEPTETLSIHLVADYFKDDINGPGYVALNNPFVPGRADPSVNYLNTILYKKQKSASYRAETKLELGEVTLTSLTGYQTDKLSSRVDADGNSVQVGFSDRFFKFNSFQQELRLSGELGSAVEWQLGGYYYNETNTERFFSNPDLIPTAGQPPVPPFIFITPAGTPDPIFNLALDPNTRKTKSYAIFTHDKVRLSDTVTATVGARFNHDKATQRRVQPAVTDFNDASFDSFTWRAGLDWQPTPQHLIYASVSTGFKAGGANEVTGTPNYKPERITAYEIGWKGRLFDNRLRFNTAAFYYDYKDLQVTVIQNNASLTANAPKATVYGFEADGRAQLSDIFAIDASATYVHSKVGTLAVACPMTTTPAFPTCPGIPNFFPSAGRSIDVTGNPLAQAPRLSATIGAEAKVPVSTGTVIARFNYSYRSSVNMTIFADVAPFTLLRQGRSHNEDASLRYENDKGQWYVEGFVNNIANNRYLTAGNVIPPAGIYGSYSPPRTYGARFGIKFD